MSKPFDNQTTLETPAPALPMQSPTPRWLRRVRLVRRLGYIVALVFLIRFAHERWTTPAVGSAANAVASETGDLVTQKLSMLFSMPPIQRPTGQVSAVGASDSDAPPNSAFLDPWNPEDHAPQAEAVAEFLTPAVAGYVEQALEIADSLPPGAGPRQLDWNEYQWSWWGGAANSLLPHQIPIRYLLLKARVALEGERNPEGFRHILAALRLSRVFDLALPHVAVVERSEALTLAELSFQLRRAELSRETMDEIIAALSDQDGLSLTAALRRNLFVGATEELLNRYYTRDDHDNGWLVLRECGNVLGMSYWQIFGGGQVVPRQRSRAWNLLSPLFYNRTQARASFAEGDDWVADADSLSLSELLERSSAAARETRDRTIRDGPLMFLGVDNANRDTNLLTPVAIVAQRRSGVLLAALAAYRASRGEYPTHLSALVPEFLAALPLEPYSAKPFEYERDEEGGFRLQGDPDAFRPNGSPFSATMCYAGSAKYSNASIFSPYDYAPARPTANEIIRSVDESNEEASEGSE